MNFLRIALAQRNFTVGDFTGNLAIIREVLHQSRQHGVQLVAFPELALTGYPPEDLLLKPQFLSAAKQALSQITKEVGDLLCIVGTVHGEKEIYNTAAILHNGQVIDYYYKRLLPNYGVFDEMRYFKEGDEDKVLVVNGIPIGVSICEDIWFPDGPVKQQAELGGAKLLLNISSSPYHHEKWKVREQMLSERAIENHAFVAYVNLVGGQDELVFDGGSVVFDPLGKILARAKFFEEDLLIVDIDLSKTSPCHQDKPKIPYSEVRIPESDLFLVKSDLINQVPANHLNPIEDLKLLPISHLLHLVSF